MYKRLSCHVSRRDVTCVLIRCDVFCIDSDPVPGQHLTHPGVVPGVPAASRRRAADAGETGVVLVIVRNLFGFALFGVEL